MTDDQGSYSRFSNNSFTPVASEMPPWRVALSRAKNALIRLRRRFIPSLVWYGDELDVLVTFPADRIMEGDTPNEAFAHLFSGRLHEARCALNEAGIEFDVGAGFGGRDWEWDFSLRGPINVKFKRRAKRPERRAHAACTAPSKALGET